MKKYLTLKNCVKALAFVFGLVAALMVFANQVHYGSFYYGAADTFFGNSATKGAVLPFIGYLLIALATIAFCVFVFVKLDEKLDKIITFALAGALLVGAIFVFLAAATFNSINGIDGLASLAGGPVVAGIFAILAALAVCGSEFVPNKALLK